MKKITGLLLFSFLLSSFNISSQVNFQYVGFDYAKKTSFNSGKSFFVYFTAADCAPCVEMNKTTFKDPQLAADVNGNVNAYKVDINSSAGSNWVNKFAVYNGPVVLFFDKNGNMMQRVEHKLTAENMQRLIADPASYHEMKNEFVSEEEGHSEPTPVATSYVTETTDVTESGDYDFLENSEEIATPADGYDHSLETVSELAATASESKSIGRFTVQTGIFTTKKYAERMVKEISSNYNYPVMMQTDVVNGKTMHRVLVGEFSTENAAEVLNQKIKNDGRDAFVKEQ